MPTLTTHSTGTCGKSERASCSAIAVGLFAKSEPSQYTSPSCTSGTKTVGAAVVARIASRRRKRNVPE